MAALDVNDILNLKFNFLSHFKLTLMALFWALHPIGVWLANYKAPEAIVVVRVLAIFY